MISAIFLAAGSSERMGSPKLLLPLSLHQEKSADRPRTMFEVSLSNLSQARIDEIIVVLGKNHKELKPMAEKFNCKTVYNPDYEQGMTTSIICGAKEINQGSHGIMIVLADQPFIKPQTFNMLVETFSCMNAVKKYNTIVLPTFKGKRGRPVIFHRSYLSELLSLNGDIGAREILRKYSENILEIEVKNKGVLIDIDTKEEYENLNDMSLL